MKPPNASLQFDLQALEELVIDNPDLERLEALLDQFNLFEAVGMVRHELRHSDFLAFLLNPQQPHGLGDLFLKRVLQRTLTAHRGAELPFSLIDLDVWSLDAAYVLREWSHIDLLVVDEVNRFVVLVENKLGTSEHSDQLRRYQSVVGQHYPGFRVLALYLTPEGDAPSDERYLPVSYGLVVTLIEQLLDTRSAVLGSDLQVLLRHYAALLRTHVVSDSEIDQLCRRIYQKHRRALDLIYEKRPDQQDEIRRLLESIVAEEPDFVLDQSSKGYIRFAHRSWDALGLTGGQGWTPTGRVLLFRFNNDPDKLTLHLVLGPGPEHLRETLHRMSREHRPPFNSQSRKHLALYNRIYVRKILAGRALNDAEADEIERQIRADWHRFKQTDLPSILSLLASQSWQDDSD